MWNWKTLRDPRQAGYENVVYSFHWYNWGAKTTAERNQATASAATIRANWKAWATTATSYKLNPLFQGVIGPVAR